MKFDEYLKIEQAKHYRKKPRQPERNLQEACVKWFRLAYPKLFIFAVPNGGSRNQIEAHNMRLSGVVGGVSDLVVIGNGKVLFVEMKIAKGRQSERQEFIDMSRLCLSYMGMSEELSFSFTSPDMLDKMNLTTENVVSEDCDVDAL